MINKILERRYTLATQMNEDLFHHIHTQEMEKESREILLVLVRHVIFLEGLVVSEFPTANDCKESISHFYDVIREYWGKFCMNNINTSSVDLCLLEKEDRL